MILNNTLGLFVELLQGLRCFYSELMVFRILLIAEVEKHLGPGSGVITYGRERHTPRQMPTEDQAKEKGERGFHQTRRRWQNRGPTPSVITLTSLGLALGPIVAVIAVLADWAEVSVYRKLRSRLFHPCSASPDITWEVFN